MLSTYSSSTCAFTLSEYTVSNCILILKTFVFILTFSLNLFSLYHYVRLFQTIPCWGKIDTVSITRFSFFSQTNVARRTPSSMAVSGFFIGVVLLMNFSICIEARRMHARIGLKHGTGGLSQYMVCIIISYLNSAKPMP